MTKELTPRQQEVKDAFIKTRGFWNEATWGQLLRLDPDFLEAYTNFSSKPWRQGVLPPKVKSFIYIAIDACTTHLHEIGTRQHIRNALKQGATKEEILEIFELISVIGIHAVNLGVPILVEELKNAGMDTGVD